MNRRERRRRTLARLATSLDEAESTICQGITGEPRCCVLEAMRFGQKACIDIAIEGTEKHSKRTLQTIYLSVIDLRELVEQLCGHEMSWIGPSPRHRPKRPHQK